MIRFHAYAAALCAALAAPLPAGAQSSVQENTNQVEALNAFADELLDIVAHWDARKDVRTTARIGGYKNMPDYFREVEYLDAESGRLLARVRWINETPDLAQMIEVFLHDRQGRLVADYFVSYMAEYRNAPMYALINLHQADDELRAFRQFDLFGEKLYEHCEGEYFGDKVDLSIDSYDPTFSADRVPAELYASCFGFLPLEPGRFVNPAALVPGFEETRKADAAAADYERLEASIAELDRRIAAAPDDPKPYVARGKANFQLQRMEAAAADFSRALEIDGDIAAAWFGRGMALGRLGRVEDGIADLTQYINRNPESAIGYTKRGVRRIWIKDFEGAVKDLKMAVTLDDRSAEAHDDLGVALAQTGRIDEAVEHFLKARAIDPGYQKVHHNLAMVLYMTGDLDGALGAVGDALDLAPDAKNSVLLKSAILDGLGRAEEARVLRERAEFLPDGNWSERSAIQ